jgi:thioredoxin reductase (NADPH)
VRVFGRPMDPAAYVLRDFLSRTVAKYTWTELTNDQECIEALGVPLDRLRLPVVYLPGGERLEAPDPAALATRLGWVGRPSTDVYDLSIYGAGPAGLSAAVYAASEGLHVAVIERDAVGGQAGYGSLIENYLGFPAGISGACRPWTRSKRPIRQASPTEQGRTWWSERQVPRSPQGHHDLIGRHKKVLL